MRATDATSSIDVAAYPLATNSSLATSIKRRVFRSGSFTGAGDGMGVVFWEARGRGSTCTLPGVARLEPPGHAGHRRAARVLLFRGRQREPEVIPVDVNDRLVRGRGGIEDGLRVHGVDRVV